MEQTFKIEGMTCRGCQASVQKALEKLPEIEKVSVSLENGLASLEGNRKYSTEALSSVLPSKYLVGSISTEIERTEEEFQQNSAGSPSKWAQLRPMFLIFFYLFSASVLMNIQSWETANFMLDFMGLFYIVFSFFKFLDYKGFPASFSMYDPVAKAIPAYGWIYPFLELGLGLMFLFRFQLTIALISTLVLLGITTYGVTKSLLDKRSIKCACLGTALNLPMTEATFIENAIMIVMAVGMLLSL